MKNLLFILLLGLGFSQTELTTRVYEFNLDMTISDAEHYIDLYDITGYDLDYAMIEIIGVDDYSYFETAGGDYQCDNVARYDFFRFDSEGIKAWGMNHIYIADQNCRFIETIQNNSFNKNLLLSITAEFPEEDTGYIEEGFEFCVHPGANLVSYPCDNPVSIEDALPSGVENYITSIIGEGLAAIYLPTGDWVGGLVDRQPGSGYWFKSNSNLCFEYDCVAD